MNKFCLIFSFLTALSAHATPESIYTLTFKEMSRSWPSAHIQSLKPDGKPIQLLCLETPGNDLYIGLEQVMWIEAPLTTVDAVLSDIEHYQQLFPGYDQVKLVEKKDNSFTVFWEQHIPVFFMANIKFETVYTFEKTPQRVIYRYQLKEPGKVKFSDGLIVLDASTEDRTRFVEYDFFDVDYGALKTLGASRIWRDSVESLFLADMALKLKSERPELSYAEIATLGKKALEAYPMTGVLARRARLDGLEISSGKP